MENIYDTDAAFDNFDFNKLVLTKPTMMTGGNYFIRFLADNSHLYIQPPKCNTKQGIIKAGKRFYTDLMFTNENEHFIHWMEKLESHCQKYIYNNRQQWFDGEMELHDIENYFTSPLKIYKSGKFYIARINISTILGKPALKIYDERENEVDMGTISDKTNVMTILEIQGIKCSARSFQIEIELKQMMVLNPTNMFEKCIITSKSKRPTTMPSLPFTEFRQETSTNIAVAKEFDMSMMRMEDVGSVENETVADDSIINSSTNVPEFSHSPTLPLRLAPNDNKIVVSTDDLENDSTMSTEFTNIPISVSADPTESSTDVPEFRSISSLPPPLKTDLVETPSTIISGNIQVNSSGLEEVEFNLEEISKNDTVQLKQRNDVYYEMYREARRKAKMAREMALSAYLEAKKIKNTYLLTDISDSDDENSDDGDDNNDTYA